MRYTDLVLLLLSMLVMTTSAIATETVVHRVQTAVVAAQDVDETLHIYGKVSFDDAWTQNISLAYAGQIARLPVLAGEPVKKEQLLAEIVVDPAAAASYQQMASSVRFAKSALERTRSLFSRQLATRSQLAKAEKTLADSQSSLQQLRQQGLGKSVREIRAPFDAIVAMVPVQAGQRVSAGMTLMQLGHPDRLKVLLGVEAEDIRWIRAGNAIEIHPVMNPDLRVRARVDKVLHAINPQTRLADVLVRLSGDQTMPFLPGMTVSADISARQFPQALVIPRSAVMYGDNNMAYVMRIAHDIAEQVSVQVVLEKDGHAVVQGKLLAGQVIASTGVAELSDGDAISQVLAQ